MKVKIKNGNLVIRIPLADIQDMRMGVAEAKPPKPKEITHTAVCVKHRAAMLAFDVQWPLHCRTCSARGFIVNNTTQQKIGCPRCLEFGLCPRCGNSALSKISTEDGTFVTCPNCEWDQQDAYGPSAEAAGLTAPQWRCTCEKENADDSV